MVYDDDGALTHVDVTSDPVVVDEYVHWRQVCQANAVPLRQYLPRAGLRSRIGFEHHFQEG